MKHIIFVLLLLSGCGVEMQPVSSMVSVPVNCAGSKLVGNQTSLFGISSDNTTWSLDANCSFEIVDADHNCFITGFIVDNSEGSNIGTLSLNITSSDCNYSLTKTDYSYTVNTSSVTFK